MNWRVIVWFVLALISGVVAWSIALNLTDIVGAVLPMVIPNIPAAAAVGNIYVSVGVISAFLTGAFTALVLTSYKKSPKEKQ